MKNHLSGKKIRIFCSLLIFVICHVTFAFGAFPPVRVKDIAHVLEARENQLMGFGLVVGLNHTGDSMQTGFTKQALANLMDKMGLVPKDTDFKSRNVAAVIVTANIPAFVRSGQKIDVVVSSVGDASSLSGGTLLQAPLMGADNITYAVAQGQVLVHSGSSNNYNPASEKNLTMGRVPSGAIVEAEIPVTFDERKVTVVLDNPDFTTASRLSQAIINIGYDAKAVDAGTVVVPVPSGEAHVDVIANIESATLVPDVIAKVVINEKTGIVVIGENVRMAPIAVAYKGFTVTVGAMEGAPPVAGTRGPAVVAVAASASISDLVKALNSLGATPADLIAILESIKEAGALPAEIEVIS